MFNTLFRRGVPVVLALLLTLSFAGPVAAAPVEAGPVVAVWEEMWGWFASLWEGEEGDRGPEIDPNGQPTGDRGPEIDPDGLIYVERGPELDPNG
jgi:hypothetical protein